MSKRPGAAGRPHKAAREEFPGRRRGPAPLSHLLFLALLHPAGHLGCGSRRRCRSAQPARWARPGARAVVASCWRQKPLAAPPPRAERQVRPAPSRVSGGTPAASSPNGLVEGKGWSLRLDPSRLTHRKCGELGSRPARDRPARGPVPTSALPDPIRSIRRQNNEVLPSSPGLLGTCLGPP